MAIPELSVTPISEKLYTEMHTAFRPLVITPDTTREDIMYTSGQQSVLRWLNAKLKRKAPEVARSLSFTDKVRAAVQILWRGYAD